MKCVCLRGLMGEDCVSWLSLYEVRPPLTDLPVVGEERNLLRELELELACSKLLWGTRFRYPVPLPLLGLTWSENIAGPLRGELMRFLEFEYRNSEAALEDESEKTSPLDVGLLLFSSSSTFGSMLSMLRSSHPRAVLNCARASRALSFRPIYKPWLVLYCDLDRYEVEEVYLANFSPFQHSIYDHLRLFLLPGGRHLDRNGLLQYQIWQNRKVTVRSAGPL